MFLRPGSSTPLQISSLLSSQFQQFWASSLILGKPSYSSSYLPLDSWSHQQGPPVTIFDDKSWDIHYSRLSSSIELVLEIPCISIPVTRQFFTHHPLLFKPYPSHPQSNLSKFHLVQRILVAFLALLAIFEGSVWWLR
ncbi:hypothetical protein BJ878DRAFT_478049 [Calycina marina]|uniref:Uncharacterized protein n=1 Tax=Calycina marina TaxID=1763456 RepID=A0A9P7Z7G7_9HELO|nr:hypothetical protein BJ878DRAFT_478049 [Calycina marina]